MCTVLDAERQLLETCCKEAVRAVKDQPLSARSWAWFHFLTQLLFTSGHRLSTGYDYDSLSHAGIANAWDTAMSGIC